MRPRILVCERVRIRVHKFYYRHQKLKKPVQRPNSMLVSYSTKYVLDRLFCGWRSCEKEEREIKISRRTMLVLLSPMLRHSWNINHHHHPSFFLFGVLSFFFLCVVCCCLSFIHSSKRTTFFLFIFFQSIFFYY